MWTSPQSPRYIAHGDAADIPIDITTGSFHRATINGARTLSLINWPVDGYLWLRIFQVSGTPTLPTWPPGIPWIGTAPANFTNAIVELFGSGLGTIDGRISYS
jgi:hypothetical protein